MNEQIRLMALVVVKSIAVVGACIAVSGRPLVDEARIEPSQAEGAHFLKPGIARVVPATPLAS